MDPKEIENIKSQVDDLNALFEETIEPSSDQDRWREELGEQILRLQDDELDEKSCKRLEKQLRTDGDALDYYVEFVSLSALLHLHYHPDRANQALHLSHCS